MTATGPVYQYRASVRRWVDGDTVDLAVDAGFDVTVNARFRLYGVDTPERGQAGHDEATRHNETLAPIGATVTARTYKTADKYGRWLAVIVLDGGTTIQDRLLNQQLARPYFGGTKHQEDQ